MSDGSSDRLRVTYEQNFAQARNLNVQMNRVPTLAMTLTGGLWFGAGATEHLPMEMRFALLILAGLSDLALILAALRIRDVLESYFEKLEEFCFRQAEEAQDTPARKLQHDHYLLHADAAWCAVFLCRCILDILALCRISPRRRLCPSCFSCGNLWPFAVAWNEIQTRGQLT